MSTRGLTGFISGGKKFLTYNHFDSYPEGLGMEVLEFCKLIDNWDDVREKLKSVILVSDDTSKPTIEEIERYERYSNTTVSKQTVLEWYCLLRELQGVGILIEIARGRVNHMIDSQTFLSADSWCEWAYIINLDEETLEVYHDGNKLLYEYNLNSLPKFMLGVTNEFKKRYTDETRDKLVKYILYK